MEKRQMLQLLSEKVAMCSKCPELVANRTQTVMHSGNIDAKITILAEAPGADEDKTGEVLIGRAGKLLTNIINSTGLDRSKDCYLCNIAKCRPPNNRPPTETECNNCRPFLELQLKIINPQYIVCLGNTAAQNLLKTSERISCLRGQWFSFNNIKVLCTWHPSYALRNKTAKFEIYQDLMLVVNDLK